jgi:hypothetical protein
LPVGPGGIASMKGFFLALQEVGRERRTKSEAPRVRSKGRKN